MFGSSKVIFYTPFHTSVIFDSFQCLFLVCSIHLSGYFSELAQVFLSESDSFQEATIAFLSGF
jgi:hypothetical protein